MLHPRPICNPRTAGRSGHRRFDPSYEPCLLNAARTAAALGEREAVRSRPGGRRPGRRRRSSSGLTARRVSPARRRRSARCGSWRRLGAWARTRGSRSAGRGPGRRGEPARATPMPNAGTGDGEAVGDPAAVGPGPSRAAWYHRRAPARRAPSLVRRRVATTTARRGANSAASTPSKHRPWRQRRTKLYDGPVATLDDEQGARCVAACRAASRLS